MQKYSIISNKLFRKTYNFINQFFKVYFPKTRAKLGYRIAYKDKCNLNSPKTFSEKLLWLSLNTYRNNLQILQLSDKFLVREYIERKGFSPFLNELLYVWRSEEEIEFDKLPDRFVMKISQGCSTNIICKDKSKLNYSETRNSLRNWLKGERLYDLMISNVGGIFVKELKKFIICEKFLESEDKKDLIDYKIYCFNGEPKAILVIADRFTSKNGVFMDINWSVISHLKSNYKVPSDHALIKPKSLDKMLEIATTLSKPFPFVRVDMYDVDGLAIFGEMTFFPNGCIKMQETDINGVSMGEMLQL